MSAEEVRFRSADGIELEGVLDGPSEARGGIVLCHPHPQLGGTMEAPLLLALRDALVAADWIVLRFNFRGIGNSGGESSTGSAEIGDATAALELISQRCPEKPIAIMGWSFGGAVAVRAAARSPVAACAAIAPSVNPKESVTEGLPDADDLDLDIPVLFVCGENDDVIAPEDCRTWVQRLRRGRYIGLPGANHFFWAKYDDLAAVVTSWLDEVV